MNPASSSSVGKLHSALRDLQRNWQATDEAWQDSVRKRFEEQYYEPMAASSMSTIQEMRRLQEILMRAAMECR